MSVALTTAQMQALQWLAEHGGEGVLDTYAALIAQGKRYKGAGSAPTWLRLFTTGHVESAGRNRIRLSALGRSYIEPKGVPVGCSDFTGTRARAPMLDEESEAA